MVWEDTWTNILEFTGHIIPNVPECTPSGKFAFKSSQWKISSHKQAQSFRPTFYLQKKLQVSALIAVLSAIRLNPLSSLSVSDFTGSPSFSLEPAGFLFPQSQHKTYICLSNQQKSTKLTSPRNKKTEEPKCLLSRAPCVSVLCHQHEKALTKPALMKSTGLKKGCWYHDSMQGLWLGSPASSTLIIFLRSLTYDTGYSRASILQMVNFGRCTQSLTILKAFISASDVCQPDSSLSLSCPTEEETEPGHAGEPFCSLHCQQTVPSSWLGGLAPQFYLTQASTTLAGYQPGSAGLATSSGDR